MLLGVMVEWSAMRANRMVVLVVVIVVVVVLLVAGEGCLNLHVNATKSLCIALR